MEVINPPVGATIPAQWGSILRISLAWFATAAIWFMTATAMPLLAISHGHPNSAAAVLAGATSFGIAVSCLCFSRMINCFRPAVLNQLSILVVIMSAMVTVITSSYLVATLSLFTLGLGVGVRWIISDGWITELGNASRGRAVGIYESISGLTLLSGPLLAAILIDYPKGLVATTLLLGSAIAIFGWRAPPTASSSVNRSATTVAFVTTLKAHPAVFVRSFIGGAFESGSGAIVALWLVHHGTLSSSQAALLVAAIGTGSCLSQTPLGYLSERISSIKLANWCALALIPSALILAFVGPSSWSITASTALLWGALGGGLYTLSAISLGETLKSASLYMGVAVATFSYTIGSTFAPLLGGFALDLWPRYGPPVLFLALALCSIFVRKWKVFEQT